MTDEQIDDDLQYQTLQERDTHHDWADKLADAIGLHLGVDVGEHTSANNPWNEALDAIMAAPSVAELSATQADHIADERKLVAQVEAAQDARYIVIGYGESDHPQASFANDHDELLDAVLGMIYTRPSDACDDTREEYRRDLADEDEWCGNVWRTEFEIGGIVVYDTGASASPQATATQPARGGVK